MHLSGAPKNILLFKDQYCAVLFAYVGHGNFDVVALQRERPPYLTNLAAADGGQILYGRLAACTHYPTKHNILNEISCACA